MRSTEIDTRCSIAKHKRAMLHKRGNVHFTFILVLIPDFISRNVIYPQFLIVDCNMKQHE